MELKKSLVGGYYYVDDNGKKSEKFYKATEYENGIAVVQKVKDGKYQMRDLDGNLVGKEYFKVIPHWTIGQDDRFMYLQEKENGKWVAMSRDGHFSPEYATMAPCSKGFCRVQLEQDGPYYFIDFSDSEWHQSKDSYFSATDFDIGGKSLVKKDKGGPYYFRDIDGSLSIPFERGAPFVYSGPYPGFAIIMEGGEPWYLDMLGRKTKEKTATGAAYALYRVMGQGLIAMKRKGYLEKDAVLAEAVNREYLRRKKLDSEIKKDSDLGFRQ